MRRFSNTFLSYEIALLAAAFRDHQNGGEGIYLTLVAEQLDDGSRLYEQGALSKGLHRLKTWGFLVEQEEPDWSRHRGPRRRLYTITGRGKLQLAKTLRQIHGPDWVRVCEVIYQVDARSLADTA